tara:strand:- start:628 stop:1158 length:531 start_codon:yes stop_codon:yes gene_type:complete
MNDIILYFSKPSRLIHKIKSEEVKNNTLSIVILFACILVLQNNAGTDSFGRFNILNAILGVIAALFGTFLSIILKTQLLSWTSKLFTKEHVETNLVRYTICYSLIPLILALVIVHSIPNFKSSTIVYISALIWSETFVILMLKGITKTTILNNALSVIISNLILATPAIIIGLIIK